MSQSDDSVPRRVVVDVSNIQYLSEKAIQRAVHRSGEWVKAHAPLMPGCDYTPAGYRRVPRVCVEAFVRAHDPANCTGCESLRRA